MNRPNTLASAWRTTVLLMLWLVCGVNAAAVKAAPLDIANCPLTDVECVKKLVSIRALQQQAELNEIYVAACRRIDTEAVDASNHRMATLRGQYVSGWLMLFLGFAIITTGLVMSWVQMSKGLRDGGELGGAVEIGLGVFKVQSPVVGLLVFGASIYFFSIYIDKVYRITDVLTPDSSENKKADPRVVQRCNPVAIEVNK